MGVLRTHHGFRQIQMKIKYTMMRGNVSGNQGGGLYVGEAHRTVIRVNQQVKAAAPGAAP